MSDTAWVGIDPGLKTGLAVLGDDGTFYSWEADWEEAVQWVNTMASPSRPIGPSLAMVIVEDFIVNRTTYQKSREPEVLWAIGALKWLSLRRPFPLKLQGPSARSKITAKHIQAAGWWHPSSGHARDASKHLLAYCLNAGIMQESFTEKGALRIEYAT